MSLEDISARIDAHERRSQERYEALRDQITHAAHAATKGKDDMSGISEQLDKININMPGHDGGAAGLAPLLALAGGGGGLGGNNSIWPILLLALLGRNGNGGLFGGNGDGGGVPAAAILNNLQQITASIPTTALETQNAFNQAISSLALGTQQGLSNVKDSVQINGAANIAATNAVGTQVQTGTLQNILAIGNDGDKTRALIQSINDQNLQRQLAVAENALAEERTSRRVRDVEVNVTQQVTQNQAQLQAQAQQQQQFGLLASALQSVVGELQVARATNANLIIGNTGATTTGAQTASPINVRS